MKDELDGKTMTKFVMNDSSEDKKAKGTKTSVIKRKLKFENYKNCLEATQLENKTNCQEKNQIDKDNLKKNHEDFIRNNKSTLKAQKRLTRERHNVFTEEINNVINNALKLVSAIFKKFLFFTK